jgi:hypothetical protein
MAFKSIGGSRPASAATCLGTRGWPAEQDHPAYIPRPGATVKDPLFTQVNGPADVGLGVSPR